jgi:predicted negative regulator of RcsB-dependent stress response
VKRFGLKMLIVLLAALMLISGGYVGLMRHYQRRLDDLTREGNAQYQRLIDQADAPRPATSPSHR